MIDAAVALRDVFCVHRTPEGDAAALAGLDLEVSEGEHLCVLGPSGAGKTTLLRVIAGLEQPSAGSIFVFGRDVGRLPATGRAWVRHRWIGFLDQHAETTLTPDLPIARAVELPLLLRGEPRRARRARAAALLEAAGLTARADAFAAELSGGERQTAALCAALVHKPRLLLADEPTAQLDAGSARRIASLIAELAESNGATVIAVAHDPALAEHADRTIRIRDGRVVEHLHHGDRSLLVSREGWVQLPADLRDRAGIDGAATAAALEGELVLRPTAIGSRSSTAVAATGVAVLEPTSGVTVELRGVTAHRGHGRALTTVLEGMDTHLEPRQLTAVTGRSGAGKTTLLELIACLRSPADGKLLIGGEPVGELAAEQKAALRRRLVGYLAQEPSPIDYLTAVENIALALAIRGRDRQEGVTRAEAALASLGLGERAHQRVGRLSAGERQRVSLACAVACSRGLLVLDEPSSRLDEHNAAVAVGVLRAAASAGQTVICATHDAELIASADQIIDLSAPFAGGVGVVDPVQPTSIPGGST